MSQFQTSGGQPQKQGRYSAIHAGRLFNGLVTNRSPLRGNLPNMYENFYKLSSPDIMIAGANVEVSNRLTLIRRPGNPQYDTVNTWNRILAFDEFRVNKGASDVFGIVLEKIYTMVDEPTALFALDDALNKQLVFTKSPGAGQTNMQAVGNTLYFSNGVDNKKWLQSLFTRTSASNNAFPQGADGLAGTYPFGTFLIDPNNNIQELIGIKIGDISHVHVASDVLTLTVTLSPDVTDYPVGTHFTLWNVATATWLNGATITTTAVFTHASSTTIVAQFTHADYDAPDTGYVQQVGTIPIVAKTGNSVPTWGTTVPSSSNNFNGSITLDGNIIWINRGSPVENWGIAAPTETPKPVVTNTTTTGWKAHTFYSAPGVIVDANLNIWQVTTEGITGNTNPFTAVPTPTVGQTVTDGTVVWTCRSTSVGGDNLWAAHTSYIEGTYGGAYPWTAVTIPADGQFLPDYTTGKYIIANAAGTPCLFELQKNIPNNNVNVPISSTFSGGTVGFEGWTAKFFNHAGSTSGPSAPGIVDLDWGGSVGNPVLYNTVTPQTPSASATGLSSIMWNFYKNGAGGHVYDVHPMKLTTVNPAGEMADGTFTTPWGGMPSDVFEFLQFGKIRIPVPGMNVTFTIPVNDAAWFGVESTAGATFTSFSSQGATGGLTNKGHLGTRTLTPWNGYPILGGWNGGNDGDSMTIVINFPNAGVFGIEFAYGKNSQGGSNSHNFFYVVANGSLIVPEQAITTPFFESSTNPPSFGSAGWNLLSASQNTYPSTLEIQNNAPWPENTTADTSFNGIVINGNQLRWLNLGPVTDFAWPANTPITPPSALIIDTNSNEQRSYETGVSGTTQPTWQTALYSTTADQVPLVWINEGSIPPVPNTPGKITATSTQGWKYWVALVNTLDNTVSNAGPASLGTGPVISGNVYLPPGSGLDPAVIDPQADFVAIFRTVDGGSIPLLIPTLGNDFNGQLWTVPLTQYLQSGYLDTTPDVDLDELVTGAIAGENTPPFVGAINLSYHLNRIWYSVGNTVWYTSGPTAPSGNGNGTFGENFDVLPSLVKRLVPTAIGMLVFTVSDIFIIPGNGTTTNPILPAIPYMTGVGLSSYNALDINGSLIGFYTTDKQFVIFNPSAGLDYVGNPIGDQFSLNNGKQGQSWNGPDVYVSWYTNGQDQAWFVCDGVNGWYKLIATPSPETGNCWSPFASVNGTGSVHAIKAVEVSPGVHKLLTGPASSGRILARNLNANTDGGSGLSNGSTYPAYAVFGSYLLAEPGQVAVINSISSKSVNVGTPLIVGVIVDEALPYYNGSFTILKNWVTDPTDLPQSKSITSQRFYMSEDIDESAYCDHFQLLVQWPAEAASNELISFAIFGKFQIEM